MTKLHELYDQQGQSPWLDNIKRGWITGGELEQWVERGVRGLTSNPTILQKAISAGTDYDAQFNDLVRGGQSVADTYWQLVTTDIQSALEILAPVHASSDGEDGFVSIEVAPELAHDTAGTVVAARTLHESINAPNLYVKIPGTAEGVDAIRQMIAEGRSINVTLLFGLKRYGDVIDAYLTGLEQFAEADGDLSQVRSVASFFVSRVDTVVDQKLEDVGTPEALALRGKAAVANARLAYQLFLQRFNGPRWQELAAKGAHVQRPLWASTSTKNPEYLDTMYVDTLVGPDTVNTMPENTLEAFMDHGVVTRTIDADPDADRELVAKLSELGIDLEAVAVTLEDEGVAAFAKSFDELLTSLEAKAGELGG